MFLCIYIFWCSVAGTVLLLGQGAAAAAVCKCIYICIVSFVYLCLYIFISVFVFFHVPSLPGRQTGKVVPVQQLFTSVFILVYFHLCFCIFSFLHLCIPMFRCCQAGKVVPVQELLRLQQLPAAAAEQKQQHHEFSCRRRRRRRKRRRRRRRRRHWTLLLFSPPGEDWTKHVEGGNYFQLFTAYNLYFEVNLKKISSLLLLSVYKRWSFNSTCGKVSFKSPSILRCTFRILVWILQKQQWSSKRWYLWWCLRSSMPFSTWSQPLLFWFASDSVFVKLAVLDLLLIQPRRRSYHSARQK